MIKISHKILWHHYENQLNNFQHVQVLQHDLMGEEIPPNIHRTENLLDSHSKKQNHFTFVNLAQLCGELNIVDLKKKLKLNSSTNIWALFI